MNTMLHRAVVGAAAGTAATAAMSVVMLAAKASGKVPKIAPEIITEAGMDAVGADTDDEPERTAATVVAHFAYGAGNGAAFAVLSPKLPGPTVAKGMAFAAAILAGSYQGWVPAAGIMPRLDHQAPNQRRMLVLSHAVYGAVLGAVVARSQPS